MINPATPVETLTEVLDIVDYVLVMSVNPGIRGPEIHSRTCIKSGGLADLRTSAIRLSDRSGWRSRRDTVADVVRAGAEILVAGNAVFGQGDPTTNAQKLLKMATEAALQKV